MKSDVIDYLTICNILYKSYEHILNSYVSDFYVDRHWDKLPQTWKNFLNTISMEEIGDLLDVSKPFMKKVCPLSLLSIRMLLVTNGVTRKQIWLEFTTQLEENKEFMNYFWKNVKLKKRHEINIMSQICYQTGLKTDCSYIVDVGSGLGHLSRMLSYGYGFQVCTFESDNVLVKLAKELDHRFEKKLLLKSIEHKKVSDTIHINKTIECNISANEFLYILKDAFGITHDNFRFGIVGLHPCGNLGATLLRLYNQCPNAVFINIVSCCYMKLTLEPSLNNGFPLSHHCKSENFKLSYLTCEIACHAIENYIKKLRESCTSLKIHAFRAALEGILVAKKPDLKHCRICNVKYEDNLCFKEYCRKALKGINICITEEDQIQNEETINKTWQEVVAFYSVRLLLAPIIESIILYDRLLYVKEGGSNCHIFPAFNCDISPRNHVLSARKIVAKK